jgi:hypothetical protein
MDPFDKEDMEGYEDEEVFPEARLANCSFNGRR